MVQLKTACLAPFRGVLCLLVYLLAATPLVPLSVALVAWADGDHTVTLGVNGDGLRIVLGHDAHQTRTALGHSHCLAAQALVWLAEPGAPNEADHVLVFHGSPDRGFLKDNRLMELPPIQAVPAAPMLSVVRCLPPPPPRGELSLLGLPPPALPAWVIRKTVFLI